MESHLFYLACANLHFHDANLTCGGGGFLQSIQLQPSLLTVFMGRFSVNTHLCLRLSVHETQEA